MNKHQKKLRSLDSSVYLDGQFRGHRNLDTIRAAVVNGDLKVVKTISAESAWSCLEIEYDFNDPQSTSTYDDCISVELRTDEILVLRIQDGENMHGQPIGDRVTFHLAGSWWNLFSKEVDRIFENMCMRLLKQQEEEVKLARARIIGEQLLRNFDKTMNVQEGA